MTKWRDLSSPTEDLEEFWRADTAYDRLLAEIHWVESQADSTFDYIGKRSKEIASGVAPWEEIEDILPAQWHWEERQALQRWALYLAAYSLFEYDLQDYTSEALGKTVAEASSGVPLGAEELLTGPLKPALMARMNDWNAFKQRLAELRTLRNELAHRGGYLRKPILPALARLVSRGEIETSSSGGLSLTRDGTTQLVGDLKLIARIVGVTPYSFQMERWRNDSPLRLP